MIKLFIFDLDHTALGGHDPYEEFPPHFAAFLDKLAKQRIKLATNTTWEISNQFLLWQRSSVKTDPFLLCGSTGRSIGTIRKGSFILDEGHEKMVLNRDKRFKKKNWPVVKDIFTKIIKTDLVDGRISYNQFGQNLISITCKKQSTRKVWKLVQPLIDSGQFYPWSMEQTEQVHLLPAHMNKGAVVRLIQKKAGIKPEHTLIAGDGINDRHMMDSKFAKYLVCPANADPVIKELVSKNGGYVSEKEYSWGVVEGVKQVIGGRT